MMPAEEFSLRVVSLLVRVGIVVCVKLLDQIVNCSMAMEQAESGILAVLSIY